MNNYLLILLFIFSPPVHSSLVGEKVKCRGFLKKNKQKKFYILQGKALAEKEGDSFVVYGHSPVLGNKYLHIVKKKSCIASKEKFPEIKKVAKISPKVEMSASPKVEMVKKEVVNYASFLNGEDKEVEQVKAEKKPAPKQVKNESSNREAESIIKEVVIKDAQKEEPREIANNMVENEVEEDDSVTVNEIDLSTFKGYLNYLKSKAF